MKVRFDEIPADGLRLTIKDEAWFPDHDLSRDGGVRAQVELRRDGARVIMAGSLAAKVRLDCDRCCEPFVLPLDEAFLIDFELAGQSSVASAMGEHLLGREEMDTVFLDEPAIDVYEILAQQIFLAMPEKILCDEECRGLCSGCGVNLNQRSCHCGGERRESPFGALAGVMVKKK